MRHYYNDKVFRQIVTDDDGKLVEDNFSCSDACAYCPNEPEIKLRDLKIKEICPNGLQLKVTTNDNIKIIRVLTYITVNGINYDVKQCSHFKTDNFIIHLHKKIENLKIGDDIIGYKEEQPRSYINTEPAVSGANRKKFDPVLQIYDRSDALISCVEVDKIGNPYSRWNMGPLSLWLSKEFIQTLTMVLIH